MEELGDGVWRIRCYGLPNWTVNAYLLEDAGTLTLVDAGLPWNARTLRRALETQGYQLSDVDRVLFTHYDLDHFGGILPLASDLDVELVSGDPLFANDGQSPLLHHKGIVHRMLQRVLPRIQVTSISEGDTIGGFTAYRTPGHNPGHMSFVHQEKDIAFLGDLVREVNGSLRQPVFWDNYDRNQVRESICSFAQRTPAFSIAAPGHGSPIVEDGSKELQQLADTIARGSPIPVL